MIKKILIIIVVFQILSTFNISIICQSKNLDRSSINEPLFDSEINYFMKIGHLPSLSACIIKNGTIVWSKSYGYKNVLKREKADLDTVYLAGSISKTITATAIMQLYEKGFFNLDDDVNKYLDFNVRNPNYPKEPITFRMLLSHHASIAGDSLFKTFYLVYISLFKQKIYPYPLIKNLLTNKIYSKFIWADTPPVNYSYYESFSSILLQYLVEKLTNQSFEDYCNKNIFLPLEMKNTSFIVSDFEKNQLAIPYANLFCLYIRLPQVRGVAGPGGLRTSVNDLSKFLIAIMNGGVYNNTRILNESTVDIMETVQFPNSTDQLHDVKFGLGLQIWNYTDKLVLIGHTGQVPGGTAIMEFSQSNNTGIVFFINEQTWLIKRPLVTFAWQNIFKLMIDKMVSY